MGEQPKDFENLEAGVNGYTQKSLEVVKEGNDAGVDKMTYLGVASEPVLVLGFAKNIALREGKVKGMLHFLYIFGGEISHAEYIKISEEMKSIESDVLFDPKIGTIIGAIDNLQSKISNDRLLKLMQDLKETRAGMIDGPKDIRDTVLKEEESVLRFTLAREYYSQRGYLLGFWEGLNYLVALNPDNENIKTCIRHYRETLEKHRVIKGNSGPSLSGLGNPEL